MNISDTLLNLIVKHINEVHDIELENAKVEDDEIHADFEGEECIITLMFTRNEITQECIDIEMYSDDIFELDDMNIDRDDRDNDDIYDELNDSGDFDHFMNNEQDDDEDRGQSL